ncbi:crotonase/enoyl-CoA hydratase family protein [Rhizobium sp. TH2]|uniref:crotonase/enoyl-CoA hydratase family protein n=1 Tax=Rhizobium sp. TH2 TaxID=2775403 RepID=UPI0021588888|nr:crotonase/enoyl-CoA hydratase family protein [Rhizobium sp. TH2]UVC10058.1 crotonase/enoyl-CoA hydratase family protein [Rhizobium sp. TH2]
MTEDIKLERPSAHPGILVIRMHRRDKKNAITRAMYRAMADALDGANADEAVKAAVIFGVPGIFSSGNDLADFMEIAKNPPESAHVLAFLHALANFEKPLLSGVDGIAIGIGTTMNFHCDLTFTTPRTVFRTPFTDLAVVPEAASSLLGPRIMGHQRAFAMLVGGIGFSAEQAREAGIVWSVVDEDELEAATLKAALHLINRPRQSLMLSRKLVKGDRAEILGRMDEEMVLFMERLRSDEATALYKAFFEKKR